jgi:hypothetical protein
MGRSAAAVVDFSIVAVMALSFFGPAAWDQTAPTTGGAPAGPRLQAELLKTIDASRATVGDEVTARTVMPLEFDGAHSPTGATVIGHVTEAGPSRLVLVFDHIRVKKNPAVTLGLSLRAVMMPQSPPHSTGDQVSPRAQGLGAAPGKPATQSPLGGGGPMRSPEAVAQDSAVTVFDGPSTVQAQNGDVVGLPGVQLRVSDDPKAGASFQLPKNRKLQLEKGLQVMFVVSK